MKNEDSARRAVLSCLETLKEAIGGEWPLTEAFTDLDDHPERDEDAGFNYNVGYVTGLCEAFGWDVVAMCLAVEPDPPESDALAYDEDEDGDLFDFGEEGEDPDSVADQANDEWE